MKITTSKPKFTPVDITFTFETQEELDAMGSLFNCPAVTDALREHGLDAYSIIAWNDFKDVGACLNHSKLEESLKRKLA